MVRLSYSQIKLLKQCKRQWYNSYILKLPDNQEKHYADRGTTVHKILELWYQGKLKDLEEAKLETDKLWHKYKLDKSPISKQFTDTWIMILNGINKKKTPTSLEAKYFIHEPAEFLGYLDQQDTNNHRVTDWKTDSQVSDDHKHQMQYYAWLYWTKYGVNPFVDTEFLKKNQTVTYKFTEEELLEIPREIRDANEWIERNKNDKKQFRKCCEDGSMCNFFCPYKEVCFGTDKFKVVINLYGSHFNFIMPMNPMLHKAMNRNFSYELKDAFFIRRQRPGFSGVVNFWNPRQNNLPLGFLSRFRKMIQDWADHKKISLDLEFRDYRQPITKNNLVMPDKLLTRDMRSYQKEAVDKFLKEKIGILNMATGAGKTAVAVEITRQLNVKTSFIVGKIELMKQAKENYEKDLGIEVGMIGQGVKDIKDITVATIQTLTKDIKQFQEYLDTVQLIIVDEAHHVSINNYSKLLNHCPNTHYRLGLTGTAFRTDGHDMALTAGCGEVIYTVSAQEMIEQGFIMNPTIKFIKNWIKKEDYELLVNGALEGFINEELDFQQAYNAFVAFNPHRNQIIVDLVKTSKASKILILTKLVEHGKELSEKIEGSKHLHGSTPKKERDIMFEEFSKGDLRVLVSTLSIFGEGLDIPEIEVLCNCSANKTEIASVQTLGRLLRKHKGKESVTYYDFLDKGDFVYPISRHRLKTFQKEGYQIEYVDYGLK